MSKTKAQLEEENEALRELTAALIGMLAAVADAEPPMPADPGQLHKYDAERGRRFGIITVWADPSTDTPGGLTASIIDGRTGNMRRSLSRPLRYEPDLSAEVLTAPVPDEAAAAIVAKAIETGEPVIVEDDEPAPEMCGATLPLRNGGELKCTLGYGHYGAHSALAGERRWHGTGDDARREDGTRVVPDGSRS